MKNCLLSSIFRGSFRDQFKLLGIKEIFGVYDGTKYFITKA
jgi:hypothetical protein